MDVETKAHTSQSVSLKKKHQLITTVACVYTGMMRRNLEFKYIWNSPLYPTPIRDVISLLFLFSLPCQAKWIFHLILLWKEISFFLHTAWLLSVSGYSSVLWLCLHQKKSHCCRMAEKEWESLANHKRQTSILPDVPLHGSNSQLS